MSNKVLHITFSLCCFLLYNSCSKDKTFDCLKSTGKVKKEERYFSGVRSIRLEDNVNLFLMQSMDGKIVVEAGENLLPKIVSEQQGETISIRNENKCNWVRSYDVPVNVYVGVDRIKKIAQSGYGTIRNGETIQTDTLRINSETAGVIELSIDAVYFGFVADDKSSYKVSGAINEVAGAAFKNASVNTENATVSQYGISNYSILDVRIYCEGSLHMDIAGEGNIICKGNPQSIEYRSVKGTGKLILL